MTEILDKIIGILGNIIVFGFLALVAIFVLAIISLPTVFAYFVNRWLRKRGVKYIGIILLIVAPVWTVYEVYTAIYPTDNFYFSEFKYVTLRKIPKSATIINKDASYPDFHGDYCSASLISLSSEDYRSLLNDLTNDNRISKIEPNKIGGSAELYKVMGNLKTEQIVHSFTRKIVGEEDRHLFIGFLADKKTIVVSVCVT